MTLSPEIVAARFVEGRSACAGFANYPGPMPESLDAAYAVQAAAIAQWARPIAGWKVGRITGDAERTLGENRFIGPVFAASIWTVGDAATTPFPIIEGGFGAVEAELVARIDCPRLTGVISADEALAMVTAWHTGIEVAGSPLASIHALGPLASIAGFGNNIGLILGPTVSTDSVDAVQCTVTIGSGDPVDNKAGNLPGGPAAAIAFALNRLHRLGQDAARDILISTGAITGVHPVEAGYDGVAEFRPGGTIAFRTEPMQA